MKSTLKEMLWLILLFLICVFTVCWQEAQGGLVKVVADLQVCSGGLFCQQQTSYGSGVCVGDYRGKSIVLTAGHLFQGHDKDGLVCPAKLRRLRVHGGSARVIGSWVDNKANDFAILLVDHQFKEVVPIGLPPKAGDTITVYGYDYAVSSDPQFSTKTGKITKVQQGEMTDLDFTSAVGVSGGPAIDSAGNLAGLLVWSSSIMPNIGFRQSIKQLLRDANLPPPNPEKFTRGVPEPPEDSLVDKTTDQKLQAELEALRKRQQAEIDKLKKEKAAWLAKQQSTSETTVSDTGNPSPGTEDTSQQAASGDSSGSGSSTQESTADQSQSSQPATGEKVLKTAEGAVGIATALLGNPFVATALGITTAGTGLAGAYGGLKIAGALLAWRRRRKEKQGGVVGQNPPPGFQAKRQLHTRDTTEAAQLIRLGRLEGRDPLLDSFVGITFQDMLKNDIEGERELSPEINSYARSLWDRVTARVESAAPLSTGSEYSDNWRPL